MGNKTCGECKHHDKYSCLQLKNVVYIASTHLACIRFCPKNPTVFDRITASPEVLAEKLVLPMWDGAFSWESTVIPTVKFSSRAEAIAATVAKLKEVIND